MRHLATVWLLLSSLTSCHSNTGLEGKRTHDLVEEFARRAGFTGPIDSPSLRAVDDGSGRVARNQHLHSTAFDGKPLLFEAVRDLALSNRSTAAAHKVLSFGTSFGLEALSLATLYFPHRRDEAFF